MSTGINELITVYGNGQGVSRGQEKFLDRCLTIHEDYGQPFTCYDFPHMSKGNFRQYLRKLKKFIEIAYKSNPCQYRIKGTPFKKRAPKVTNHPTGADMLRILQKIKEQPPALHDIKGKFSSTLHQTLCDAGQVPHPKNKGFFLKYDLDYGIHSKVQVYSKTVQFDLACSNSPLAYDISGILRLTSVLAHLRFLLLYNSDFRAQFPPINEWVITHYHLNKDYSENYSNQAYHMAFEDVSTGFVRCYSKHKDNGNTIHRFEQIVTPRSTLDDEMDKVILQQSQEDDSF